VGAIVAQSAGAQASGGTVTGTIIDRATRQPVVDARVVLPGTALETQSNARGEYRIPNVPPGRVQVGVFRIGYKAASDTVRVAAGATATLDFTLTQSVTTLSDIVVTGTAGNQERRAQSAAVASVSAADIKKDAAITNVGEMLTARVPGISVNSNSGTAGTAQNIRIRGASSISLSNEPLVFIDGVLTTTSRTSFVNGQQTSHLNDINPDDIESIEVVKGPAAATLYGADASAGVIQIITKKGRAGSNSFTQTLRAEGGPVKNDWTPPDNYGACTAALVAANSTNPLCRGQAVGTLVHDNPLMRYGAFRTGAAVLLGWSGRGGGQNYGYFLSAGADRNMGTLPNNDFQRESFRSNFNFIPTPKITIDAGFNVLRSLSQLPDNDNNIYGFLGGALLGSPLSRTDDGSGNDGWYAANRHVDAISAITNTVDTRRTIANASATWLPWSWFKNRITIGGDLNNDETTRYFPKNSTGWYAAALNVGQNSQGRIGTQRLTFDYLADLTQRYGSERQLEVNLSAGAQVIGTRIDSTGATGLGFVTNASNVISSASSSSGGQARYDTRQVGYLGQLQLGWRDRLFLQVGGRLDDFSAFGKNTPAIFLPKVGASWVVSDEDFFRPLTPYFNSLRLRAAFGTTGRAPQAGAALTTLTAAPYASISGSAITTSAGAVPLNPGNADLRPEKGSELEVGLEATTWHERIALELTYFDRDTKDLILQQPLPPSLGFTQNPFVNIGEVRNKGFEVAVNGQLLQLRNLGWESRVSFNTLDNTLVSLGGVPAFGTLNRFTEGYQLGSFVSKRVKNVDVANHITTVADTFEVVGNVLPTFEGSWSNTFTILKNFRLSALVDTKRNFDIYNNTDYFRETQLVRSNNRLDPNALSPEEFQRRYGPFKQLDGKTTTVDEARDGFLSKGDFVRFRELSLTYTLPHAILSRLGGRVSGGSIGVALQNIHLWSDYPGADPEVVSSPTGSFGFSRTDFLTLPTPKTTLFRLNLSF
jgi:TonB-linked SusC/RagA family outer membrane protein